MNDLFVAWFLIDEPYRYPILLSASRRREHECGFTVPQRVYQEGVEVAGRCKIYRTIHVGTYSAYRCLLESCLK